MIPVPFIYLFARKFLIWGYHKPLIGPICRFCINKGEKGGRALEAKAGKGMTVALLLFVGIPLPGTGAWTGTLAADVYKRQGLFSTKQKLHSRHPAPDEDTAAVLELVEWREDAPYG